MRRAAAIVAVGALVAGAVWGVSAIVGDSDDDDGGGGGETDTGAGPVPTADANPSPPTTRTTTTPDSPATTETSLRTAPPTSARETPAPQETQPAPATLGEPDVVFTHLGDERGDVASLAPGPDGRLYQVVLSGTLVLTDPDGTNAEVALDITDRTEADGEQGLLSVALTDDGRRGYVNYTDSNRDGMTVIAEYSVDADGMFAADSARTVMTIEQPHANHNAGDMRFGPDGYLYVATGDGGSSSDPDRNALDRSSLLGKILRIDPAGSGEGGEGGTGDLVPPDNPFVDEPDARGEIWAYGLRNPWRFDFDEPTGDLWIADVGQQDAEEINVAPADDDGLNAGRGTNFGWSAYEGDDVHNEDQRDLVGDDHHRPLHTYDHSNGDCSVSGAATYHGDRIEGLAGGFVFGDFCSGRVWAIPVDGEDRLVELGTVPSATGVHEIDDEVYITSLSDGLYRVDPA